MPAPVIEFFEFDISEVSDPTGSRDVEGGSFAFKQRVALGCQQYGATGTSGTLIFEGLKYSQTSDISEVVSDVTALVMHKVTDIDVSINNMRLYLTDDSAFQGSQDQGLDRGFVQMTSSGVWQPNGVLPSGVGTKLSVGLPVYPNVFQQDGELNITGIGDVSVSQFLYLNVVMPVGSPLGDYGVCGSGLLRFGFTFDFWPI